MNCNRVKKQRTPAALVAVLLLAATAPLGAMPLSPGDKVRLVLPEGEGFSGSYEVDGGGALDLPHLGRLPVAGLEPEAAARRVSETLVEEGYFQKAFARTNLQVLAWAPINVEVEGATFNPGRVLINPRPVKEGREDEAADLPGDATLERNLAAALRAAGGVRPNADLAHIRLIRAGVEKTVDLSGVLTDGAIEDVPLQAGDRIVVPAVATFQASLVRPSQITPPGIMVFLSNLTQPATNNASSHVDRDVREFAYGSRFSQAVIAANCLGGTQTTNADRYAVLVRTSRETGETKTLDRSIEQLIRHSDDTNNPLLMPGDGVACYDSGVTNTRSIFQLVGDILNPFSLLFGPARILR
ncbi:polysaccharide biosynthesis/export family protein [Gloeobacter kilaueensis]|uniref:Polysaccharide export protein n=1 Tax=Gloeobacter kilaueensis (strain ATCC BAA-2537 / CCAP 1431/1 / ULC 316 / JS1) TaxID=1183438 RepID=U5QR94_GLOK1|nr:polysaccharide biosynthesis/export family protein [Gloeobacter kilaueensis]AGY60240.1 polysaccharide export protein [Gloeobacter kilaueensis JS1]